MRGGSAARRPGGSLLETVRVRNGIAPLWRLHVARLGDACRALGIRRPGTIAAPEGGADRIVRYAVDADGVVTTERPHAELDPVRLVVAREVHVPYPFKTTERDPFERALREARGVGADDAVLLTARGMVAEAALWGLFWWEGAAGDLAAPAQSLGILRSVARARIAELAGDIADREVGAESLAGKSLFVANAARGIVEVAEWESRAVPPDARTAALAQRFWG